MIVGMRRPCHRISLRMLCDSGSGLGSGWSSGRGGARDASDANDGSERGARLRAKFFLTTGLTGAGSALGVEGGGAAAVSSEWAANALCEHANAAKRLLAQSQLLS